MIHGPRKRVPAWVKYRDSQLAESRLAQPDPENPTLEGLSKNLYTSNFVIEVLHLMERRDSCDNAGDLEALARAADRYFWEEMIIRDMLPSE
jgi:hypothetical protein